MYIYIYICTDSPFVGLLVPTLEPMVKPSIPSLQLGQPKWLWLARLGCNLNPSCWSNFEDVDSLNSRMNPFQPCFSSSISTHGHGSLASRQLQFPLDTCALRAGVHAVKSGGHRCIAWNKHGFTWTELDPCWEDLASLGFSKWIETRDVNPN